MEEEIKIIAETLSNLSESAIGAFIWYLIAAKIIPVVVSWGGGITLACIVLRFISKLIGISTYSLSIVKEIRDELNLGSGALCDSDCKEVVKIVPSLISAYKKSQGE